MTTITEAELRTLSGAVLDRVRTNHEPLQVKLANGERLVLASLEDYNERMEMDETDFLLSNPKNSEALRAAIDRIERGEGVVVDLDALAV